MFLLPVLLIETSLQRILKTVCPKISLLVLHLITHYHRTIGPLLSPRKKILRRADKHLTPVVAERFRKEAELGEKYTDKPVFYILLPHNACFLKYSRTTSSHGSWTRQKGRNVRFLPLFSAFCSSTLRPYAHRPTCVDLQRNKTFDANFIQTFTHVLYDIAAFPEHVQPLRDEVQSVVQKEGWTRASLNKMYKIDSFLSESQRYHGIGTRMRVSFVYVLF